MNLYQDNFKEISRKILIAIAETQKTEILKYILSYFEEISGGSLTYEDVETDEEVHLDQTNKIVLLPTTIGAQNNFYEYHFLLKQQ